MEDLRPRGIVPGVEAAAVMADGLELQGMNCRGQAVSAAGEDGQLYPLSIGIRDGEKTSGAQRNLRRWQKGILGGGGGLEEGDGEDVAV